MATAGESWAITIQRFLRGQGIVSAHPVLIKYPHPRFPSVLFRPGMSQVSQVEPGADEASTTKILFSPDSFRGMCSLRYRYEKSTPVRNQPLANHPLG